LRLFPQFKNYFKKKSHFLRDDTLQPGDPDLPKHIAIIMDGNGRWAQRQSLPRTAGHQAGLKKVREITEECGRLGIKVLTLFAFSTENWKRPAQEVSFLMNLFYQTLKNETEELDKKGVKLRFIGFPERLTPKLLSLMKKAEEETVNNSGITLNLAINYGGRAEIISAIREMIREAEQKGLNPEVVTGSLLEDYLLTSGQPDPDLIIRTSGEQRISNFLLWQGAYAELYFTETLWPDFGPPELNKAIIEYQNRSRRFGGIKQGGGK
jgi:undecaprenyl diphosphate synthase